MAESELKLDTPCPRCGTSNIPSALRCRQCFHELPIRGSAAAPGPVGSMGSGNLFDWTRPVVACEACGKSNPFNVDVCLDCGAPLPGDGAGRVEDHDGSSRRREAVKGRRRAAPGTASDPSRLNLVWLARLCAVLFMFWGVIDTSSWLNGTTKNLAPSDPAAIRYFVFAIYELVRDFCIMAGIWLLTLLKPRR